MQDFWLAPSHHELLRVSGPDAERFLQGQVTCDVAAVADGNFAWGAACNNKGRVIAPFVLYRDGTDLVLVFRQGLSSLFMAALRKFLPFYKCTMTQEEQLACAGVGGSGLADWTFAQGHTCAFHDEHGIPQLLILAPAGCLEQPAWHEALAMDDGSAWHAALLYNGHYPFQPEDSEQFTPQELQYEERQYVSFSKGCYTGQEIVARMHYRGKAKKRLYRVELNGAPPPPQEPLVLLDADGKPVAECSKLVCVPSGPCVALAMLPIELAGQHPTLPSSAGSPAQLFRF